MPEPWYAPLRNALFYAEIIAGHAVAASVALAGDFWLHHMLVEHGDPKMFDLVPWRYAIDFGGLVILSALTAVSVIEIRNAVRGEEDEEP